MVVYHHKRAEGTKEDSHALAGSHGRGVGKQLAADNILFEKRDLLTP